MRLSLCAFALAGVVTVAWAQTSVTPSQVVLQAKIAALEKRLAALEKRLSGTTGGKETVAVAPAGGKGYAQALAAREFNLVGPDGQIRGSFCTGDDGQAILAMRGAKEGTKGIILRVGKDGLGAIELYDAKQNLCIYAVAKELGGQIRVHGDKRQPMLMLSSDDGHPMITMMEGRPGGKTSLWAMWPDGKVVKP